MLIGNLNAKRETYPAELKSIMSIEKANESRAWLSEWSQLNPSGTPLYSLPDLAAELGVADILVKDESERSLLGSFKALGAPIALVRLILREFPEQRFEAHGLLAGKYASALADFTVISATDGNHGRALAAAAQSVGCRCVIVLHANVSVEREDAIAAYGAEIVRITGNYDESVEEAAALADQNGWLVVSDTSYDGYEDIPRDVMQGYGTIAAEIIEAAAERQSSGPAFTHVFLQGGVGGLAAGIASYLWELYGEQRPTFVVVEPEQADCLYQSAIAGKAAKATGSVDSVMAGLACGETSPLAWKFLQPSVDFFMTIQDDDAVAAMRRLANGSDRDIPLVAGESAVAGLAGLIQIVAASSLASDVGITAQSRVLLISTEGATAPGVYAELVGETADAVLRRQKAWAPKA
ncbi:diaminopropionate ammonia-lyase [Pseudomonas aeruginosa]|uniref:diaminopropionate ammonia-lyase n=1 Tax=Pseudomonas aeruginosa TaxID=287 RepID=UPI000936F108|nr:diaminopropionate ammonia-lyase [Pseudomonas aeruginosa]MCT5519294.1 diaminopropionate ammonia-lyase [Pseudomonas aeruginosa]MEE2515650.1 diaminopropionate ammonia-lyase [Pseudomonas aeruginosa]HEJ1327431.1 diaminopropionate ammonia-lyase [Pseudomonas aeruginosa]